MSLLAAILPVACLSRASGQASTAIVWSDRHSYAVVHKDGKATAYIDGEPVKAHESSPYLRGVAAVTGNRNV